MAYRDPPTTPLVEVMNSTAISPSGATARVKNASTSHKPQSYSSHMTHGSAQRRSSKTSLTKSFGKSSRQRSNMADSEGDKKRNQLNYKRITLACAHCRRRKIRCRMEQDDSSAKCEACEKLGKECIFVPVEQHVVTDHRAQTAKQSLSVTSSPTDIGSNDEGSSFGSYAPSVQSASNVHPVMLGGYDQPSDVPGLLRATDRPSTDSPWLYNNAMQQDYHSFAHSQYSPLYPTQFANPASTGDFSPYPVYTSPNGGAMYSHAPSAYADHSPLSAAGERFTDSSGHPQQWSSMPNPNATFPHGYLQTSASTMPAYTSSVPGSAFADSTYYSGTSENTPVAEADPWYSSYG